MAFWNWISQFSNFVWHDMCLRVWRIWSKGWVDTQHEFENYLNQRKFSKLYQSRNAKLKWESDRRFVIVLILDCHSPWDFISNWRQELCVRRNMAWFPLIILITSWIWDTDSSRFLYSYSAKRKTHCLPILNRLGELQMANNEQTHR